MSSSQLSEPKPPSYEVCIELLQNAKTDNEKLASLMLVPKLLSSQNLKNAESNNSDRPLLTSQAYNVQQKGALLEAIGFPFIRRLLTTGQASTDGTEIKLELSSDNMALIMVGLSVTNCFTEQGILEDTQVSHVVASIETLMLNLPLSSKEKLQQGTASEAGQPQDQTIFLCIEILDSLARDQSVDCVEKIILPALYKVSMKQESADPLLCELVKIVKKIVRSIGVSSLGPSSLVAATAINLQLIKVCDATAIDFECFQETAFVLNAVELKTVPPRLQSLTDSVMGKLCDICMNKLPGAKRQQVLKLLTSLIQLRSIRSLIKEKGSKAALLVIHLCSIEVRMTLEQDDFTKVLADSETLCSSFFALEQMIFYMAHDETTLQLDSREVIQVHSALQGAVGAILYFLTNVAIAEVLDTKLFGVIAACVRLLGAWTAEETESLIPKYTKALPDLVRICELTLDELDCMKFLIPGLSNLTTDGLDIVKVILSRTDFITKYLTFCCTQLQSEKEEYEHILVNCCVVVLNCIMMPDVEHDSKQLTAILNTVAEQTNPLLEVCKNVDCCITMIVCGLTALRKLHEIQKTTEQDRHEDKEFHLKFYKAAVKYLLNMTEQKSKAGAVVSSDIPEIWLMGIQVLGDLMKTNENVKKELIEAENIKTALQLFEKYSSNVDVVFVLERLLVTMAEKSGAKELFVKINKAKK